MCLISLAWHIGGHYALPSYSQAASTDTQLFSSASVNQCLISCSAVAAERRERGGRLEYN